MELNLEEQTLIATFRGLDDLGRQELLRYASQQRKSEATDSPGDSTVTAGQCKLERGEERPERIKEPIFTE